jgi:hypothetical protein
MDVKNNKLRFIIADNEVDLVNAIERLNFKVEIKQIIERESSIICYFTVLDNSTFKSQDLTKCLLMMITEK